MALIAVINYVMSLCCLEKATDTIEKIGTDRVVYNIYKVFSAISMLLGIISSLMQIGVIG